MQKEEIIRVIKKLEDNKNEELCIKIFKDIILIITEGFIYIYHNSCY